MKAAIGVIIAVIVLGGGYYFYSQSSKPSTGELPKVGNVMEKDGDAMMEDTHSGDTMMEDGDAMDKSGDAMMEKETEGAMEEVTEVEAFDISGVLQDVSGGNSSGDAKAKFADGVYTLVAIFEGLPEPQGTDFYEGWIVRRGSDMSVISTGIVDIEEIGFVDHYISNDDLLDHDFYVLTLEPDDGDPAPAAHILEGVLQ